MIERASRAWGARPLASSLAAAMFAASPLAWRLASEPEVFMLNVVLALGVVSLAAPTAWRDEGRRAIALAFVAGLGIANHHSVVLLAPIGLLAWGRAVRRAPRPVLAAALSVGALTVGLLPYAYLMSASESACSWGDTSSLGGLLHHFLRRDYGTTKLATGGAVPEPLAQIGLLGQSFLESLVALPLLAGLVFFARRRVWSWDVAALALAVLLAGPIFVSRFNLPPRGLFALVVVRFHLLPLALASVLGARGLDAVIDSVRSRPARIAALGALVLVLLLRAGFSRSEVLASHRPTTERYLRNVLSFVPPRSVVVAVGDDLAGGFEYMQCALGERRDVVVIAPHLMLTEWYGRRVDDALGLPVEHGSTKAGETRPSLDGTHMLDQLLASDRPVFLTGWFMPNLHRAFPSYPIGPLLRLVRDPREVPPPPVLLAENQATFERLTLDEIPPVARTWEGVRYEDYGRPWNVLATAFEKAGDVETAASCRRRALALRPVPAAPASWR